jgi:hypothetical protein
MPPPKKVENHCSKAMVFQPYRVQGTLKEYKKMGGTLICLKMTIFNIYFYQSNKNKIL